MDKFKARLEGIQMKPLFDGNYIIPEETTFYQHRDVIRKRKANKITTSFLKTDEKDIKPNKWYILYFDRHNNPAVLMQSWYLKSTLIEWWQYKLGVTRFPPELFIIRGNCIEPNYRLTRSIYYRKRTMFIQSKVLFPPEVVSNNNRKTYKKHLYNSIYRSIPGRQNRKLEKAFFKALFRRLPEKFKPQFNKSAIISMKHRENLTSLKLRLENRKHLYNISKNSLE